MTLLMIDPSNLFQPEYQNAIADLVRFWRAGAGQALHSIYLYGSVARKTAKPNRSNLDVVVVTYGSFEENRATLINTIRWRFQKSYPWITDVSFKIAAVEEVATLEAIFLGVSCCATAVFVCMAIIWPNVLAITSQAGKLLSIGIWM